MGSACRLTSAALGTVSHDLALRTALLSFKFYYLIIRHRGACFLEHCLCPLAFAGVYICVCVCGVSGESGVAAETVLGNEPKASCKVGKCLTDPHPVLHHITYNLTAKLVFMHLSFSHLLSTCFTHQALEFARDVHEKTLPEYLLIPRL